MQIMEIILYVLTFIILTIGITVHFYLKTKSLKKEIWAIKKEAKHLEVIYENDTNKLKSDKRSLETLYGNVIENMAPYLKDLGEGYDPKKLRQLGQPIDYLYFGDDHIEIIEIKTGNSKLNQSQRRIRDQIKNGKVIFRELRFRR